MWAIRKAAPEDAQAINDIYARARAFMAQSGNPTQWGSTNPSPELVAGDIARGRSYVCVGEPAGAEILGVFCFTRGNDPTYQVIHDGAWLNESPYGVVHRLAGNGTARGVAAFCLDWCLSQCGNIRIDTHRDNIVMRKVLAKQGFAYCGRITIANGTERLAYQKTAVSSGRGRCDFIEQASEAALYTR